jgi:hypothetical protein
VLTVLAKTFLNLKKDCKKQYVTVKMKIRDNSEGR